MPPPVAPRVAARARVAYDASAPARDGRPPVKALQANGRPRRNPVGRHCTVECPGPIMVNLLVLLRFESGDDAVPAADAAMLAYTERVEHGGGQVVDREADQLLVCLTDMRWGLQSLRELLARARREGFVVRAAIVQAVLARPDPRELRPVFTARTLETLLRLAGQVGRQQVGITPKLLSLIQLAAPEFADLFESPAQPESVLPGETRAQPVLVMAG